MNNADGDKGSLMTAIIRSFVATRREVSVLLELDELCSLLYGNRIDCILTSEVFFTATLHTSIVRMDSSVMKYSEF